MKNITAEDLYSLQQITAAKLSPDGQNAVYAVQRADRTTEKKFTNLWLVETQEGDPHQFTYGDHVDSAPAWSPDGRQIAFLSNRKDEKQSQIYVIPVGGGEARQVTDLEGQIGSFQWSPDGTQMALMFRQKDKADKEREQDEQKKKLGVVERVITRVFNRVDGASYEPEEDWHIWTVDVNSGDATQITSGESGEANPIWAPDGQSILYVASENPNWDLELDTEEFFRISASGGEPQLVRSPAGGKGAAAFAPDGRSFAYRGRRLTPGHWYQNEVIFVVPLDAAEPRDVTSIHDYDVGSSTLGDFGSPPPQSPPIWSADGRFIYSTATRHGANPLLKFEVATDKMTPVFDGEPTVIGMVDFDHSQEKCLYFEGTLTDPGQLLLHDFKSGETRQLTAINQDLLSEIKLGRTEEVWIEGKDGYQIHSWVLTPPDYDSSQKYPTLLYIHGGPQTQYGRTFMHEFYFLAAQGYVVGYSNPRGGQGYGEGHAKAIYGKWNTVDYDDLMAFTDYLAALPYVDESQMGVVGGSYGGYMTGMIVGQTDRFKAACAQRMVSNFISFHGTSDFNWAVKYLVGFEGEPWNDLENYWRMSPMSLIDNVKTPTLVIHSENDLRCDKEQGEQYFVALRRHGVDSELILFPEESHGLSRGGRTDRRIARLNQVVRWFDKYLKD
ncbi:MAG: S9 family peptidase [Ardenticatenaceae bacterium]|nr:S9 family peptidase [Ardenticatenaceae bacterium]